MATLCGSPLVPCAGSRRRAPLPDKAPMNAEEKVSARHSVLCAERVWTGIAADLPVTWADFIADGT